MIAFDEIMGQVFQGAEKIVEKGKKVSSEGADITKELFTTIAERAADVTSLARLKYELMSLRKQFEAELSNLGSALVVVQRNKDLVPGDEMFQPQIQKLADLDAGIKTKQHACDQLRKKHSDDYVVNKLSEDLAAANGMIDEVIISEKSNVTNKLLKEILLPKEALVSAIKREGGVIIPDGNTTLKAGDQVIVIGRKDDVEKIVKRFGAK